MGQESSAKLRTVLFALPCLFYAMTVRDTYVFPGHFCDRKNVMWIMLTCLKEYMWMIILIRP